MTSQTVSVVALLSLCAAAPAGEWSRPPTDLLTDESLAALAWTPHEELTDQPRVFLYAHQVADPIWALLKLGYDGYEDRKRMSGAFELPRRAYLVAHRADAAWALVWLEHHNTVLMHRGGHLKLLYEIADENCLEPLRQALAMPGGPVRAAAEALAKLDPKRALPLLIEAAETGPAAELVGLIEAIGTIQDARAERFLHRMAVEASRSARREAVLRLAHYDTPETLAALQQVAAHGNPYFEGHLANELLRKRHKTLAARSPLLRPGERARIRHLIGELRGHDEQQAFFAREQLKELRLDVIPDMLPLVDDPLADVRRAALEILGETSDPGVFPGLERGLRDLLPRVRAAAAQALWQLDRPEALPLLKQASRHGDAHVRWWAARGLAAIKSDEADAELERLLKDSDPVVRDAAAKGIRREE